MSSGFVVSSSAYDTVSFSQNVKCGYSGASSNPSASFLSAVKDNFSSLYDKICTSEYCQVIANGRVVASIDNQGIVTCSSSVYSAIADKLPDIDDDNTGPNMAETRARIIADFYGGKVNRSSGAISQDLFDELYKELNKKI